MTISQFDFELIKGGIRINIEDFANNKEKIGKSYSEEQWIYWQSLFDWEEEVEVIEKKRIRVKNLRLKKVKTNDV
tara:strand:+ start:397 stop:621 length:225 start_codon:yes stop_codon:yes gene_type:complete